MERDGRWEGMGVLEVERGVAGMGERMVMAWEARGVGAGKGVDQSVVVESTDGKFNEEQSKGGGERVSLELDETRRVCSRGGWGGVKRKASKGGKGRHRGRGKEPEQKGNAPFHPPKNQTPSSHSQPPLRQLTRPGSHQHCHSIWPSQTSARAFSHRARSTAAFSAARRSGRGSFAGRPMSDLKADPLDGSEGVQDGAKRRVRLERRWDWRRDSWVGGRRGLRGVVHRRASRWVRAE